MQNLIAQRDPQRVATAYRSNHDSLPEPLCAIWEPASREPLQAYLVNGKQCPRKFLIDSNALLLDLPHARALDNVNTADEFSAAEAELKKGPGSLGALGSGANLGAPTQASRPAPHVLSLRVQYYALFREQAGCSEEAVETRAVTPAELYSELQTRHPFKLAREQLKVAVNSDFSDWNTRLANGDTVVFIPPVAGG